MGRFFLLGLLVITAAVTHAQNWNLRTSPLGWAVGIANLRLDYKVTDQWVVGPEAALLNRSVRDVQMKATGIGVAAAYAFQQAFEDGAFMEFALSYSQVKANSDKNTTGTDRQASFANTSTRVVGGYHWFWKPVNISVGGGLGTNSAGNVQIKDGAGNEVDNVRLNPIVLALDFNVGLTF